MERVRMVSGPNRKRHRLMSKQIHWRLSLPSSAASRLYLVRRRGRRNLDNRHQHRGSRRCMIHHRPVPAAKRIERSFLIGIAIDTFSLENEGKRFQDDLEIKPDRPLLDVLDVKLEALVPRNPVSPIDLGETGYPRRYRMPEPLALGVVGQVGSKQRSRTDKTQFAFDHTPKLRQLV